MADVVIFGGSGFIGSHLTKYLNCYLTNYLFNNINTVYNKFILYHFYRSLSIYLKTFLKHLSWYFFVIYDTDFVPFSSLEDVD